MKQHELLNLPGTEDKAYWVLVKQKARDLEADGCSGVPDFYVDSCLEHDIHYRTHATVYGLELTRTEADAVLRERIQEMSWLDGFTPMAWWRWAGDRLFGSRAWK